MGFANDWRARDEISVEHQKNLTGGGQEKYQGLQKGFSQAAGPRLQIQGRLPPPSQAAGLRRSALQNRPLGSTADNRAYRPQDKPRISTWDPVHPGTIDDTLTCTLNTVSLKDRPDYETLSYVWGDPTPNEQITANGSLIKITTSLHTSLRHLRKWDVTRVIWADGVCINQADVDERSSPVGMMGDIYKETGELQIWPGEVEEMMPQAGTSDTEFATDEALIPFKRFLVSRGS